MLVLRPGFPGTRVFTCLLAVLAALALSACGGGAAQLSTAQPADTAGPAEAAAPATDLVRQAGAYTVTLLADSFATGGSVADLKLEVSGTSAAPVLEIGVSGAHGLKALYCEVTYDETALDPQSAEPTEVLGLPFNVSSPGSKDAGGQLLHLAVLDDPGVVHFGEVLARPQTQAGFSGDGVLAKVQFTRQPFSAPPLRASSSAPMTDGSRAPFDYTSSLGRAIWYYANQGDYDENGETNISDLTPLALHYGETGPEANSGKFYGIDERSVIDGDGNGEINIADITPIGLNFGAKVDGFNVYTGAAGDYPGTNSAPSSVSPVGQVLMGDGSVREGESRLRFTLDVPAGDPSAVYWARPFAGNEGDAGYEGTPSEMDGDEIAVIAPNVRIIDGSKTDDSYDSEFEYISDDGVNYTVLDPPGGQTIEPDDIIVGFTYDQASGDPNGGFLRRVTGVTPLGGDQLQLATSDEAGLADVFLKGGLIKHGLDMANSQITDLTPLLPKTPCSVKSPSSVTPVTKRASASLINFNIDGTVLVNKHDGANYFTVTLPQANLSLDASIDVDADFDKFLGIPYDLNWFQCVAQGGLISNLQIVVDGHWYASMDSESQLFHASKNFFFVVFGVPVLLTFNLDVYGGTAGQAGFDLYATTGYHLDYGVKLGVRYDEDDGWSLIHDVNNDFTPYPPELRIDGSADLQLYLRPEFSVALYGALGGGMKIKPYAYGHIDGHYDLSQGPFCANWNLGGGFSADMNVYGKIFGISLFDKSWNLYDGQFELSSGQIGCVETSVAPVADFNCYDYWTTTLPHEVSLTAEYVPPDPPTPAHGSYDPDGGSPAYPSGITTYAWDIDSDGVIDQCGPDPILYYTFDQKYQPVSFTLYVTDEEGMVSSFTRTVEAEDPIG